MWGTFLLDAFRETEVEEVRDALEELLGPASGSAWSSGGVYVFWDPATRKPLYVGITGDLPVRFAQHVGLRGCPPEACKRHEIETYFAEGNQKLGYTVLAMSSLSQVATARHREFLGPMQRDLVELGEAISAEAMDEIRALEGRLIAYSQVRFGAIPSWNTHPGRIPTTEPAVEDASMATAVGALDVLLQARRTIRQLADDPLARMFEEMLHGARLFAVAVGIRSEVGLRNDTIRDAIELEGLILDEIRKEIFRSGYLDQRCPMTIGPVLDPPVDSA
ncbi:MAG TPA: hypothetical protein VFR75_11360 [Solirubrobacterales bacterium]|nr:hypothetical protein [Solirubrobacterales bacterium]